MSSSADSLHCDACPPIRNCSCSVNIVGMQKSPLVILCMDAGDPSLIHQWRNQGHLPFLSGLTQHGCWGTTCGPELISEHGIWVSLFSGIPRSKHNYFDFRQLKPGTYDLTGFSAKEAGTVPFWSHLTGGNKRCAILDAQDMLPVEGVSGIQLCNWATHEPVFATDSNPQDLLQEVRHIFGNQMRIEVKWESNYEMDRTIYHRLMERVQKKGHLCREMLKRNDFDLIIIGFGESHTGGHQLWRHLPVTEGGPNTNPNELSGAIRGLYTAIDGEFGKIMEQLPPGSNIFVVTSAGMESHFPTSGLLESFCRKLGYQISPQAGSDSFSLLSLARKLLPESIRVAISSRFSRDTRERLLADQFRNGSDWSKTRAFSIPSFYAGHLRINLKDREPQGIVTDLEYDGLIEELQQELNQITDPETGEPAVRRLPTVKELYGMKYHATLPDLWVKWRPHTHYMKRVNHPKAELEQNSDLLRDSGHSDYGFMAAAGPAIRARGSLGNVSLVDLAPTFMAVLNEPPAPEMTGRILNTLLQG